MKYNYNTIWTDTLNIYNAITGSEMELEKLDNTTYVQHDTYCAGKYIGDYVISINEIIEMLEKDWDIVEEE